MSMINNKVESTNPPSDASVNLIPEEEIKKLKEAVEVLDSHLAIYVDSDLENTVTKYYNKFQDRAIRLNEELKALREVVIKANREYESFKRDFGEIIEEKGWGNKCYYGVPILDSYDEENDWDKFWLESLRNVLKEDEEDYRLALNKMTNGMAYTLPKDIYYYRIAGKPATENAQVNKAVTAYAAKMIQLFKFVSQLSDSLRKALLNVVETEEVKEMAPIDIYTKEEVIHLKDELSKAIESREYVNDEEGEKISETVGEILKKTELPFNPKDSEEFKKIASDLHQQLETRDQQINSLKKQVFVTFLSDLYRLYDHLKKSGDELYGLNMEVGNDPYLKMFIDMTDRLIDRVSGYLKESFGITPLDIVVDETEYEDLNEADKLDIQTADPALEESLSNKIKKIIENGFVRIDPISGKEVVVKRAKVDVYTEYKAMEEKKTPQDEQ